MNQNETHTSRIISLLVCAILFVSPTSFASTRTPSSFQPGVVSLVKPSKILKESGDLPADLLLAYWQQKSTLRQVSVENYIPLDMAPTNDDAHVASRLADKTLGALFTSSGFRQTRLGRVADAVEEKMQKEVILSSSKNKTEHKLNFQLQAFQSIAKVKYSGFANAAVSYQAKDSELGLELSENLGFNTDVVLSHSVKSSDQTSRVSVQFTF